MRNIIRYPITKAEKIDALDEAIDRALALGHTGDIRPEALRQVKVEWYQSQYGGLWSDPVFVFALAAGILVGVILTRIAMAVLS